MVSLRSLTIHFRLPAAFFLIAMSGLWAPVEVEARKAWVLVGQLGTFNDDLTFNEPSQWALDEARNIMNQAIADYEKAGYEVCSEFDAFPHHFYDALADTNTCAIWFLGHGGGKDSVKEIGDLLFTTSEGQPNLVQSKDREVMGPFPHIKQVTIHACRQFKSAWYDKFPNANFVGWRGCPSLVSVYWWQFFHCYDPLPPREGDGGNGGGVLPPPGLLPLFIHPRLEIMGHDFHTPLTQGALADMAPVANHANTFVLLEPLRTLFQDLRFNFFITGGIVPGEEHLFALAIRDGAIDVVSQSGFMPQADFDIVVDGESARHALMSDPDSWLSLSLDPTMVRVRNQAQPASDATILEAVGTLLFGVPQRPKLTLTQSEGELELAFDTQEGAAYGVESTTSFPISPWRPLEIIAGTASRITFTRLDGTLPMALLRVEAQWDHGCVYSVQQVLSGNSPGVRAGALLCVNPCPPVGQTECPPAPGDLLTLLEAGNPNQTNCVLQVSSPPSACQSCNQPGTIRCRWVSPAHGTIELR